MSPPSSSMDLSDQSKEGSRRLRQYPSLLQKDPDVMSASLGTMSPLLSDRTFSRSLSVGHVPTSVLSPFGGPLSPLGGPKSLRASLPSELPFAPSLNNSPKPVSVMEQAMQRERKRRLEKEAGEKELGVDQLRAILRDERNRMSRMAADLAALQSAAVASHVQAEVHEEGRINSLMRRLKSLQHQKGRIMVELEKEEEMVHNTLPRKLHNVREKKSMLQEQILKEESTHTALQTRLNDLRTPVEEGEDEEACSDSDLVDLAAEAEKRMQLEESTTEP